MKKDRTQVLLENESVFNETLNEFSSKSYDMASVNEIIKRSGYNKGSFYYRFKDKYEIYLALLDYVFVQQVDVFKSRGFSLISKNNIKEIVYECFYNLIDLYKEDDRYYKIVMLFYNEDKQFISDTLKETVDSLYERFTNKINHLKDYQDVLGYLIHSVYINFPIEKVINDHAYLKQLVDELFHRNTNVKSQDKEHPFIKEVEGLSHHKFNLILTDFHEYTLDEQWFDLFNYEINDKTAIKKIKKISNQWIFNLQKVLEKYQNKPIFNGLAVQKLITSQTISSIEDDSILYSAFIKLVYAIIDLKKYVLLKNFHSLLSRDQKKILFNDILPIIGDLSRLIIIDDTYDLDSLNDMYIHYYDELNGFKSYHIDDIKDFSEKEVICEYLKNDRYYHKTFDSIDDLNAFLNKNEHKILSINTIYRLNVDLYRKILL